MCVYHLKIFVCTYIYIRYMHIFNSNGNICIPFLIPIPFLFMSR